MNPETGVPGPLTEYRKIHYLPGGIYIGSNNGEKSNESIGRQQAYSIRPMLVSWPASAYPGIHAEKKKDSAFVPKHQPSCKRPPPPPQPPASGHHQKRKRESPEGLSLTNSLFIRGEDPSSSGGVAVRLDGVADQGHSHIHMQIHVEGVALASGDMHVEF